MRGGFEALSAAKTQVQEIKKEVTNNYKRFAPPYSMNYNKVINIKKNL